MLTEAGCGVCIQYEGAASVDCSSSCRSLLENIALRSVESSTPYIRPWLTTDNRFIELDPETNRIDQLNNNFIQRFVFIAASRSFSDVRLKVVATIFFLADAFVMLMQLFESVPYDSRHRRSAQEGFCHAWRAWGQRLRAEQVSKRDAKKIENNLLRIGELVLGSDSMGACDHFRPVGKRCTSAALRAMSTMSNECME